MAVGRTRVLVGRERELGVLRAAAERARAGRPTTVVVEGEAGVGKSRLVAELLTELEDQGAVVAVGHGIDLVGGALPYGVVTGLLRGIRAAVGTEEVTRTSGRLSPVLATLDPSLDAEPAPAAERHHRFEAVQHLVVELAHQRMVVLVAEDVHWADPSSLDLLTYVARSVTAGQLLIVATTRPVGEQPSGAPQQLAGLVARGDVLALSPLSDDEVRVLASELRGHTVGALDRVVQLGQGIPLFVEELVAAQASEGEAVPGLLALTLNSRLTGLGPDTTRMLELAAIGQRPVTATLVDRLLGTERDASAALLTEAVRRGLLDEVRPGHYRFHHELLRQAVVDGMPSPRRLDWHRRWAETLEEAEGEVGDPEVLGQIAHHRYLTDDADRAITAGVAAGDAAAAADAFQEAAQHWYQVLIRWHDAHRPERAAGLSEDEALLRGVNLLRTTGSWSLLREVLDGARVRTRADAPLKRLLIDLVLHYTDIRTGRPSEPVVGARELPRVLDLLDEAGSTPLSRSCLFWLWIDNWYSEEPVVDRIERLLDRPFDQVADDADRHRLSIAMRTARRALAHGDATTALALARESLTIENTSAAETWSIAKGLEVWTLFVQGEFGACIDAGEEALRRLGSIELAGAHWSGVADNLACAHAWVGHWGRAHELMAALIRSVDGRASVATSADLLQLCLWEGDTDAVPDLLEPIEQQRHALQSTRRNLYAHSVLPDLAQAAVHAFHGHYAEARALLRPVLEHELLTPDSDYLWSTVLDAGRMFPHREPAEQAAEWVAVVRDAAARMHRFGLLGEVWPLDVHAHLQRALGADTVADWEAAVTGWVSLGVPRDEALCRLRLAERLVRDGDRGRAANELRTAWQSADRLGARPLVEEILATARRARIELPAAGSTPAPLLGLTEREVEVLALLAEGSTNAQIAERLYMSPKTASVHVSRIIAKLGVANRTEAAALAHRRGMVSDPDRAIGTLSEG